MKNSYIRTWTAQYTDLDVSKCDDKTSTMFRKTLVSVLVTLFFVKVCQATTCCDDGWVPYNGTCYLFGRNTDSNFFTAESYCRKLGADMVVVDNAREDGFLKNFVLKLKGEEDYWIGISDENVEGDWKVYGTSRDPPFTDWYPGQPNNFDDQDEDCAVFSTHPEFHGRWHDIPCGWYAEPVCEKASGGMELGVITQQIIG